VSREAPIPTRVTPALIVTAHPEFMNVAFDELKSLDGSLDSLELLAPDILLCGFPQVTPLQDVRALMRHAAEQRPIFVRHLAPVQAMINLNNTENDLGELALAIASLPTFTLLERGQRFAVQTRLLQTNTAETVSTVSIKRAYSSGQVNQLLAEAIAEETGAWNPLRSHRLLFRYSVQ